LAQGQASWHSILYIAPSCSACGVQNGLCTKRTHQVGVLPSVMAMALPPNWARYETDEGKEYFHNTVTNTTQWDRPTWPDENKGPSALSFAESSTSEVYQYKPGSDFELNDRGTSLDGGLSPVETNQALSGLNFEAAGTAKGGALPQTESETVSLGRAPGGMMSGFGGAVGGVMSAVAADDGGEKAAGIAGSMLEYAQSLFDVSTDDVVKRLRLAMLPFPGTNPEGTSNDFRQRPDFWGPFWVATTAVFFLAATGNFARLLETSESKKFKADYGLVSVAAAMIYGCLLAVPLVTRASLYVSGQEADSINFRQIICVYGYSLTSAIPASILCLIPVGGIRWIVVLLGLAISLVFMKANLWTDISVEAPSLKYTMIALVVIAQATIFFTYRLKFFSSPEESA